VGGTMQGEDEKASHLVGYHENGLYDIR
jgi:hypothetical protein